MILEEVLRTIQLHLGVFIGEGGRDGEEGFEQLKLQGLAGGPPG